jgi:uncharacterized integral membrane protein
LAQEAPIFKTLKQGKAGIIFGEETCWEKLATGRQRFLAACFFFGNPIAIRHRQPDAIERR